MEERTTVGSPTDRLIARLGVLEEPTPRDLQALVDLVAQVTGTPKAAVNLITSTQQHQVATHGFPAAVCSRSDSMCAAVLDAPRPVVVADARTDERFRHNPFVTGEIGEVRFYASAPLTTSGGTTVGRLCVFDTVPRTLTTQQQAALEVLAERVVDALELRWRSRELEESLARLTAVQEELRRSNEELAHFAEQVSHDLRSPLTAVLANAELLLHERLVADEPDLRPLAAGILDGGRRMARQIDEILAHASYGASPRLEQTQLGDLVTAVLEDLRPVVRAAGATVQVDPLPVVAADPALLYSVLLNLLHNAVKYSRPGIPPQVRVGARNCADGWRITVDDNGVGIPVERRDRVFHLYGRGRTEVSGTGIGLATARRLVRAHGGDMGIADGPDGGTRLWFELPR